MGGGARRGRSGFRRQRPVGRRVVLAVAVYPPSGDIFSSCGGAIGQYGGQPACRTPDRTLSTLGLLDLVKLSVDVRNSIARRRNWRRTQGIHRLVLLVGRAVSKRVAARGEPGL